MDKVELYRRVFCSFKDLCAKGIQDCSFSAYCLRHGVDESLMPIILKGEFQKITSLPGYRPIRTNGIRDLCWRIYNEFKELCANGKQPGTFKSYYSKYGLTRNQMRGFQKRNKAIVTGLPGYVGQTGTGNGKGQSIPFEDVIFEEAGFLPAGDANVITVSVDGHVTVRFPADTDVAVIARFIEKIGKGVRHVES